MANAFSNLFVGALVIGGTCFAGAEGLRILEANGAIEMDSNPVEMVTDFVQQRDVRGMYLTESGEHIGDVDCNTSDFRFKYGNGEWLNGAELAAEMNDRTENDFQFGMGMAMLNTGMNKICNF